MTPRRPFCNICHFIVLRCPCPSDVGGEVNGNSPLSGGRFSPPSVRSQPHASRVKKRGAGMTWRAFRPLAPAAVMDACLKLTVGTPPGIQNRTHHTGYGLQLYLWSVPPGCGASFWSSRPTPKPGSPGPREGYNTSAGQYHPAPLGGLVPASLPTAGNGKIGRGRGPTPRPSPPRPAPRRYSLRRLHCKRSPRGPRRGQRRAPPAATASLCGGG
jgi:hypothetical protein